jgi:hypothetical protein
MPCGLRTEAVAKSLKANVRAAVRAEFDWPL